MTHHWAYRGPKELRRSAALPPIISLITVVNDRAELARERHGPVIKIRLTCFRSDGLPEERHRCQEFGTLCIFVFFRVWSKNRRFIEITTPYRMASRVLLASIVGECKISNSLCKPERHSG